MIDSRSTIECPAAIDEVGSTTMRIGILKADETPDELIDDHGRYEEFYIKLLAPYNFDFTVYPVLQGKFPSSIDEANGWLITGSRRSVWEDEPWILRLKELIREVSGSRVPLVGICFGHQVIASALGGKVERSKEGWIVGPAAYRRASTGKIQNVLVWHQDQITICPPGAEVLAWSSSCENAILQYGATIRTFQCHPELSPAFMKDLLPLYAEELHPARRPEILNASEGALQGLELGEEIAAFFKGFQPAIRARVCSFILGEASDETAAGREMIKASSAKSVDLYDVAIVGAGVVGCAVARRFALAGAKVILIEKGADILSGASKANSAILHTGFDAPPNSLELELIRCGRQEYLNIHESLGLSLVTTGAFLCAWNGSEAEKLDAIAEQGRENGISDLCLLTAAQALADMPSLSNHVVAALRVDGEHVIDPWSAPLAYLTQAVKLGAMFMRSAELLRSRFDGRWKLETSLGMIDASAVINAAGLYGDVVDQRLGFEPEFNIRPRKGQFVVLDKAAFQHVPRIVLPVPTEITKGIVVCPTAFGNVLVGPTAEEQDDRVRATVEDGNAPGSSQAGGRDRAGSRPYPGYRGLRRLAAGV